MTAAGRAGRPPTVLVAGIGNVFLGDDGFGVEVVQRLAGRRCRPGVTVEDFGIRGFDLAFAWSTAPTSRSSWTRRPRRRAGNALRDRARAPELGGAGDAPSPATHDMDPLKVLRLARSLGGTLGRVILVGCEPETLGPEQKGYMGLSAAVEAAVDEAVRIDRGASSRATEVPWSASELSLNGEATPPGTCCSCSAGRRCCCSGAGSDPVEPAGAALSGRHRHQRAGSSARDARYGALPEAAVDVRPAACASRSDPVLSRLTLKVLRRRACSSAFGHSPTLRRSRLFGTR